MLMLPALAFVIVSIFPLPDHLAIGLILLSACPGGSTSNLASYMLRGNVALSVSLTIVTSFLVVLTIPATIASAGYLLHFDKAEIALPFWQTVGKILLLAVAPVLAGLLFRARWKERAQKLEKIFKYLMPGLLVLAIVGTAFFGKSEGPGVGIDDYLQALPSALLLNVVSMVLGYVIALFSGLQNRERFTIGIEVGIQNSALAITIASGALFMNNPQLAVPAIVYMLFPFFTALVFGYLANRKQLSGVFSRRRQSS
jgi:BASS family bile acid:Na+ symporter